MVSAETPSENSMCLCLFTICVGDKITKRQELYIGLFLLPKLHTFVFEIYYDVQQQVVTFLLAFNFKLYRMKLQFQSGTPLSKSLDLRLTVFENFLNLKPLSENF